MSATAATSRTPGSGLSRVAVVALARKLRLRADELADRMVDRYREEIPDYRHAGDLLDDVRRISRQGVERLLRNIEQGSDPTDEDHEAARASAARRVQQGVSLESFLHATRVWGQVVWDAALEEARPDVAEEREAALEIASVLLRTINDFSTDAAQGYLHELQTAWTDREMVRRDMLDALIGGNGDAGRVRRLATSLRVRLADSYVVVLARSAEPPLEAEQGPSPAARVVLRRILDTARAHLRPPDGSLLVGMRHGEVVALYPLAQRDGIADVRAQCASLATALAGAGVCVGVSSWHEGRPAIATSYSEARDAVRVAAAPGSREPLIFFDDVLVDQLLRASPHADQILERTLEPLLAYDRERGSGLVATLRAYVAAGFNLTKSAEALCVHPNTVVYRLRRIKELCGRDPQDPNDLLLLLLGLKLVALSDDAAQAFARPTDISGG